MKMQNTLKVALRRLVIAERDGVQDRMAEVAVRRILKMNGR